MSSADGQPSDMVREVPDLVALVAEQIGARSMLPLAMRGGLRLVGRSVTVPDTTVSFTANPLHAVHDRGSFGPDVNPGGLKTSIFAYPARYDKQTALKERARTAIPDEEAEAWARAAIGDRLMDYAYQVSASFEGVARTRYQPPHPTAFVVFFDGSGTPILAPDDYHWGTARLVTGERAMKMQPGVKNTALRDQLAESGSFTPSAPARDLRTDPDGKWRIQVAGDQLDSLTPVAREAVDAAYDFWRPRGAIHTKLRPERLFVTPRSVELQFRWHKNPNTFALTTSLPQTDADFRSPATDSRAWISYTGMDWSENLSTGMTRWGLRTRVGAVIHIRYQNVQRDGEYQFAGDLIPRKEYDGSTSVHYGRLLGTDATINYEPGRLISWYCEMHESGTFAAQAVSAWTADTDVATLDVLEALPGVPDYSVRRAAFHAIHDAADAGAYRIVTELTHPVLAQLGFVPSASGRSELDVLTMP